MLSASDSWPVAPAAQIDQFFDRGGNQTRMVGIHAIVWNYRNNIGTITVIEREDAPSDREYYVYDSAGDRVRKITERYGQASTVARITETIYLGNLEIKRVTQGERIVEERHALRVMDDQRCIAIRLVWTPETRPDGLTSPQTRYQLDNHLHSAVLEVDAQAQIISYEEYFAYGGTALVAGRSLSEVKLKQYRYAGKEQDALTGYYYYGARYYMPWLGRWASPDPAGTFDGLNLFRFVQNNPISFTDVGGFGKTSTQKGQAQSGAKSKKKKKKAEVLYANNHYTLKGRTEFDSFAKKIKLKANQDRRHVIGFDDVIKPSYEAVVNQAIRTLGVNKFIALQTKMYQKHNIKRAPKATDPVEKHLLFGLNKLNSTPNNLNPEAAHENQAIEHVRQQALRVETKLGEAFAVDLPELADVKKIMKENFSISGDGTPITNFSDQIRRFVHDRIDKAQDLSELNSILHETKTSTGIDLNKASGSSKQTAFALSYVNQVSQVLNSSSTTPEQALEHVWSLRDMPK